MKIWWVVLICIQGRKYEWLLMIGSSKDIVMFNAYHDWKYYPWIKVIDAKQISYLQFKSRKYDHVPKYIRTRWKRTGFGELFFHPAKPRTKKGR